MGQAMIIGGGSYNIVGAAGLNPAMFGLLDQDATMFNNHWKLLLGSQNLLSYYTSAGSEEVDDDEGALRLRAIRFVRAAASTALPLTNSEPTGEAGRDDPAALATCGLNC